jgi:hypothetical protein
MEEEERWKKNKVKEEVEAAAAEKEECRGENEVKVT